MGEPTNTSPNLNKLQTASHCSKFSPFHQSKQASEDVCLWHDAYTHLNPSVWICHPSESGVPAPRCRSSPPGCASSPGFSSWSFPALNASWPGWKPALYFSDPSGSENQRERIRGDACNVKPHLDLLLIWYIISGPPTVLGLNLQAWLPCSPALLQEPVRFLAEHPSWCCCCCVSGQQGLLCASSLVLARAYTQLASSQLNCWILLTQISVKNNKTPETRKRG